ncbi:DUF421 domain-containing protein [Paenibacillus lutrae]|uniref:DUF421 domain-containing protein n=1 Tax=Paenibacillus lutrae TaxID=2078573 RepID=A0A7X3FN56_9BACL|nr:DUF421 domain-containing protein [Paenibacillus lutrae]MVP02297.1 DUF421 domain-containing protein [Paenibacillus lutrae]
MAEGFEVALRTLISVVVLFILTKLLGKRQVSQLSMFEYITGITIGSLAAYISLDLQSNWYLGLISLSVWVAVSFAMEFLQIKSKKVRDFVDSTGTVLIQNGKVLEENLKKERLTTDELMEQLRKKNAFRFADVEFAIMEPSGDINILLTRENQPLTAKHLGIKVSPEEAPQTVIMDGKMLDEPLAEIGFSRGWVNTELEKLGLTVDNVFLGQIDAFGQLFVDIYDDKITVPAPQEKTKLFISLKKCEADITSFGLSTRDKSAKRMYEQCSRELTKMIKELEPVLKR